MSKIQQGFTIIETVVVIAVIGLLGFVGWTAWSSISQKSVQDTRASQERSVNDAASQNEQKTKEGSYKRSTTVPGGWKYYKNKAYNISFAYPPDWTVSVNSIKKKAGEDVQNAYSAGATEIFVICYKAKGVVQSCLSQVNINNQPLEDSLKELQAYLNKNDTDVKRTELVFDGNKAVSFEQEASHGFPATIEYYVSANGRTYALPTVYKTDHKPSGYKSNLPTAKDSLIMLESVRID